MTFTLLPLRTPARARVYVELNRARGEVRRSLTYTVTPASTKEYRGSPRNTITKRGVDTQLALAIRKALAQVKVDRADVVVADNSETGRRVVAVTGFAGSQREKVEYVMRHVGFTPYTKSQFVLSDDMIDGGFTL